MSNASKENGSTTSFDEDTTKQPDINFNGTLNNDINEDTDSMMNIDTDTEDDDIDKKPLYSFRKPNNNSSNRSYCSTTNKRQIPVFSPKHYNTVNFIDFIDYSNRKDSNEMLDYTNEANEMPYYKY